ncbi:enoyl-CoA hydratase-related protein [Streptomyces sp. NPDC055815]
MSAYEGITYRTRDRVATLTLNRPEARNGFTPHMSYELADAFRRADRDPAVRVVVLTGAGPTFCVGLDLAHDGRREGLRRPSEPDDVAAYEAGTYQEPAGRVTSVMHRLNKPVIAAVRGAAVGIGSTMLLPADFRLAGHDSRFGFPFTRRGIVPEGASAWYLPRLVGLTKALDWMISGRTVPAEEALAAGLLTSLHEPDTVLDAAYDLARTLAAHTAPVPVALTRQMLYRAAWADSPEAVHRLDSRLVYDLAGAPDATEGVRSFLERRAPLFSGRVPDDLPDHLPWDGNGTISPA